MSCLITSTLHLLQEQNERELLFISSGTSSYRIVSSGSSQKDGRRIQEQLRRGRVDTGSSALKTSQVLSREKRYMNNKRETGANSVAIQLTTPDKAPDAVVSAARATNQATIHVLRTRIRVLLSNGKILYAATQWSPPHERENPPEYRRFSTTHASLHFFVKLPMSSRGGGMFKCGYPASGPREENVIFKRSPHLCS